MDGRITPWPISIAVPTSSSKVCFALAGAVQGCACHCGGRTRDSVRRRAHASLPVDRALRGHFRTTVNEAVAQTVETLEVGENSVGNGASSRGRRLFVAGQSAPVPRYDRAAVNTARICGRELSRRNRGRELQSPRWWEIPQVFHRSGVDSAGTVLDAARGG